MGEILMSAAKTAPTQATAFRLDEIQAALQELGVDGWLFYFFRDNDALARSILKFPEIHSTRRWFYFIPKEGEPQKLVHRIEMGQLDHLPGNRIVYLGWRELEQHLLAILKGVKTVAMQYSPRNAVPYIARVDAGTVELVESRGAKVVSSADLVQLFEARWTDEQLRSHLAAVEALRKIVFEGFAEIKGCMESGTAVNEYMIQQFIVNAYERYGMVSDSPPIVAVNGNAGNPHYQPTESIHKPISKGDFVLFDIWAKLKVPKDAVYADITWTGFVGDQVPAKYEEIFQIVAGARDAAVDFVKKATRSGQAVKGSQVDDVSRNYIASRGYGHLFVHRTGHSIGAEHVHGNGANIDNLETSDDRRLISGTAFSIEPGIYLEEFGVRSEIDVYLSDDDVIVGGQPIQTRVIPIMAAQSVWQNG
jgi:Xaa-Pro aminopeptidase